MCIIPWSHFPRCTSYHGVRLRSVHHTAESRKQSIWKNSAVGIPLRSQTPRCASLHGVKLHGVHHTVKSSDPNFSKNSAECITLQSQALRCASYNRVKLRFVHHTEESSFAVCITPLSQTAHRGVRIENFGGLWLLLKGQSGEILYEVNTFIMKEKIWRTFFWFAKPKILNPRCDVNCRVEFFELWDRISRRNRNRIRKPVYPGPKMGSNHGKNRGQKSRDILPLKGSFQEYSGGIWAGDIWNMLSYLVLFLYSMDLVQWGASTFPTFLRYFWIQKTICCYNKKKQKLESF